MYLSISYNLLSQKQSIIQSPPVLSTIILYHSRYSNRSNDTLHYHEPCNIFFDMIIRFFGCRMESEKPRRKKSSECICNVHRVWSRHSYGNWLSVITDVSVDSPVRYIALAIITSWIRRTREVLNSQSYIRPDTKRRIGHCYPCHSRPSFFLSSGCLLMVCRRHGMHTTSVFTPEETEFRCISLENWGNNVCVFLKICIFLCQNNLTVKKDLRYW